MKNLKSIIFIAFLILYAIGVGIGCARQIGAENQAGMYEYLEGAVSGYDVSVKESIKSILHDNIKVLGLAFVGGFFLIGPILLAVIMFLKGYMAGFAITSVLRFFGISGWIFCGANLVSAAIVIPALAWYSCMCVGNIVNNRYDRREFVKRFAVIFIVILLVLLLDSILKGFLSSILLKNAPIGQ